MKTYTEKEIYQLQYKSLAGNFLTRVDFIGNTFFNLEEKEQNALLELNAWEPLQHLDGSDIHETIDDSVRLIIQNGVREGWFKIGEPNRVSALLEEVNNARNALVTEIKNVIRNKSKDLDIHIDVDELVVYVLVANTKTTVEISCEDGDVPHYNDPEIWKRIAEELQMEIEPYHYAGNVSLYK